MNAQWGIIARMVYRMIRPKLKQIVEDSSNKADDVLLQVADKLAGYKA